MACGEHGHHGRTHGAPYRGYGYVPLRFGGGGGGGGTSLGKWEHNNKEHGHFAVEKGQKLNF